MAINEAFTAYAIKALAYSWK